MKTGHVDFTSTNTNGNNGYVDILVPTLKDIPFTPTTTFYFFITDYLDKSLPNNVVTGIIDLTSPFEPQSTLPVSIGSTATISHGFLWSEDPDNTADQLTYTIIDKPADRKSVV